MKYSFSVYLTQVDGHKFWAAESKELKGCVAQGDTIDEALSELETNEKEWLETAKKHEIPIPDVQVESFSTDYSGKFTVRVSPKVHEEAVLQAKKQNISLNQYVNDSLVTKNIQNEILCAVRTDLIQPVSEMLGEAIREQTAKYEVKRK